MGVQQSDLVYYYTGGASNASGNASLGGVQSTVVVSNALSGLFDDVSGDESLGGLTEYRCVAIKNNNVTTSLTSMRAYISINTPGDDTIEIGVEAPVSGAFTIIANTTVAPANITFSAPISRAAGLVCTGEGCPVGELAPGKSMGIWIKRIVPAGAKAYTGNSFTIVIDGDTV